MIEPALLRRLELLSLQARHPFTSTITGERKSRRRGLSIEFSDFREYRPGDDLRYVDWKAYGRLEKLFLKLFLDEEDLNVHLLIDSSKSMSFGSPVSKWLYSLRAAAAVGFIALHENNRVDAASFGTDLSGRVNALRGNSSIPTFLKSLGRLPEPEGATNFPTVVRRYASSAPPSGIVFVFSDFLDPEIPTGLAALAARGHQVILVQVLDRLELSPDFDGDFNLIDSETGLIHEVTLTSSEISQYTTALSEFRETLLNTAHKYGMDLFLSTTDEPIEDLIFKSLLGAQVVA